MQVHREKLTTDLQGRFGNHRNENRAASISLKHGFPSAACTRSKSLSDRTLVKGGKMNGLISFVFAARIHQNPSLWKLIDVKSYCKHQ